MKPEVLAQNATLDGTHGLLDRRPAGAICLAVARRKDGEDAADATPVRDAEGLPYLAVRGARAGRQAIEGISQGRDDASMH